MALSPPFGSVQMIVLAHLLAVFLDIFRFLIVDAGKRLLRKGTEAWLYRSATSRSRGHTMVATRTLAVLMFAACAATAIH